MSFQDILHEFEEAGGNYHAFVSHIISSKGNASDRALPDCANVLSILICAIKKHVLNLQTCSADDPFAVEFCLSESFRERLGMYLGSLSHYFSGQPKFFRVYFNRGIYRLLRSAYDKAQSYRTVIEESHPDSAIFAQLGDMLRTLFVDMQNGDVYHLLHSGDPDPIYRVFQNYMAQLEYLTDAGAAEELKKYLEVGCLPSFQSMIERVFSKSLLLVSVLVFSMNLRLEFHPKAESIAFFL